MTSLLLHYHDRKWFHQIKKWDLQNACAFSNILRFLDGLCVFSHDRFKINYLYIYPNELEVKKKNEDVCKTSLLYASREDHDKKFSTNLIHKRSGSPFYVIYMPYLDSDIAYKILYISFVSKILHIARTAKDY